MREYFKLEVLDGGMGTILQSRGLLPGETPEDWCIDHPEIISEIQRGYVAAGSDIIYASTFGANVLKYHGRYSIGEVIPAAVKIAREAADGKARVALDVGPTGKLLKPAGDLDFEDAVKVFSQQIKLGVEAGVDLVVLETFTDLYELKAAVIAAKENSNLPIYATVALDESGFLLTGGNVLAFSNLMEALRVDAYGFNCGLGPDKMLPFVESLSKRSTRPIIVKPNAGMPKIVGNATVFSVGPKEFGKSISSLVKAGARIIGGCCGTTQEHVFEAKKNASKVPLQKTKVCCSTTVSSGTRGVSFLQGKGAFIGERINPTGKKRLKQAYQNGDTALILREAVSQVEAGADILDINCGVPGIDEVATLVNTVDAVQSVVDVPLQIDTADPVALEKALRRVNGVAIVNSVNGKKESMDAVFPIVKKYGGVVVGLCLDENGIPDSVEGRVEIAEKILAEGAKYGFSKKDFLFDALTLAVSADKTAALVTLKTVEALSHKIGVHTILGVSNVSFGLPNRTELNQAMYCAARDVGLSAAIVNPLAIKSLAKDEWLDENKSARTQDAAMMVLTARDENCEQWISLNQSVAFSNPTPALDITLCEAIRRGLKEDAIVATKAMLASGRTIAEVVDGEIVPALEAVGAKFENGEAFLPQLLMAADSAGAAFEVVKESLVSTSDAGIVKGRPIVIATVKGDIHDIGKNIVRALLENYGFTVIDLGRDVPPEKIVEVAKTSNAMMVGLSALMTTTVGAMAETVKLLKMSGLDLKTCVGGAVVTQEYADEIGADYYAKDAMRTVRIAEILSEAEGEL